MDNIRDKKLIICLAIIVAALLIAGGVFYFIFLRDKTTPEEILEKSATEEAITKQIEELDALRQQTNPQALTLEEADDQLESLNTLYQKADFQQSSFQEDAKKQIEELDELRSQY